MGTTLTGRTPLAGWTSTIKVWVSSSATVPTDETVTLGVAATKGATSLTVSATTNQIDAGNWLLFTDSNGVEIPVKVTATASAGATSLTVAAIDADLAISATAPFPSEVLDRSEASTSETIATATTQSLNTGGSQVVQATTNAAQMTIPGFYNYGNAGVLILRDRANESLPINFAKTLPNPNTNLYTKGEVWSGQGFVTSFDTASAADSFITNDFTIDVSGTLTKAAPVVT